MPMVLLGNRTSFIRNSDVKWCSTFKIFPLEKKCKGKVAVKILLAI